MTERDRGGGDGGQITLGAEVEETGRVCVATSRDRDRHPAAVLLTEHARHSSEEAHEGVC